MLSWLCVREHAFRITVKAPSCFTKAAFEKFTLRDDLEEPD